MIKALSPYYVNIPFVAPLSGLTSTQFTLNIYIWNGEKTAVPSTPTYNVVIDNPTSSTDNVKINIANWISDFIEFTPQDGTTTELINGNNQQWVKWETFYQTSDTNDAEIPTNENVKLFLRGYFYGLDGENATLPANKILIPIQDYKVKENGKFVIPILIDETTPPTPVFTLDSITLDSGTIYDFNYTKNFTGLEVRLLYKISTDTEYEPIETISNISGTVKADLSSLASGTYDFILRCFDPVTVQLYTTNSLQLIL